MSIQQCFARTFVTSTMRCAIDQSQHAKSVSHIIILNNDPNVYLRQKSNFFPIVMINEYPYQHEQTDARARGWKNLKKQGVEVDLSN